MPEKWTANVVAQMHLNGIKSKELAEEVGWNPKYLSAIMNGHETSGVAREKVQQALNRLVERKCSKE